MPVAGRRVTVTGATIDVDGGLTHGIADTARL